MANGQGGNQSGGSSNSGNRSGNSQQGANGRDREQFFSGGSSNRSRSGGTNRSNFNNINLIEAIDDAIDELDNMKERVITIFGMMNGQMGDRSNSSRSRSSRGNTEEFENGSSRGSRSGRDHGLRTQNGDVDERQFNQGRRNFADSNDEQDDRTRAGRQHDDEEFTQDELYNFLTNPPDEALTPIAIENDTIEFDLRTKIGRALHAAGLVDDEGFPVEEDQNQGSRGRGRTSSSRSSGRSSRSEMSSR